MSFTVSNSIIEFLPALKHRHDFSKIEEEKSHRLVTNQLREEDSDIYSFPPISERTKLFPDILESPKRH